jgi:trehalose 6-phosphate synthase/phosphatase
MTTLPLNKRRLLVVANRLPFSVVKGDKGFEWRESTGGLVTGLNSYLATVGKTPDAPGDWVWVGWPGGTVPETLRDEMNGRALEDYRSIPVFLSPDEMEKFYHGFCNRTIWPLFHYFTTLTQYREEFWRQYVHVNRLFCDAVAANIREGDILWVHDYHLMLLPGMLREVVGSVPISFFLHIPFPSFEVFRLLPVQWRREMLNGMLGADLVGFHTFEYTQHFLQSVLRVLGHDNRFGTLMLPQGIVKVDTFPMGIDYDRFSNGVDGAETTKARETLEAMLRQRKLVLSVDRLDYTKGILSRLEGFELLLEKHPEYREHVVMVMVVVPSRVVVDKYEDMKKQIEEYVGKVNGRFGNLGWTPVSYQYRQLSFEPLVALYSLADVALVTPLRDGMNLVAKEYIAARRNANGVLVISEMAGAVKELGEAVVINPNTPGEIAGALREALEMPEEEQRRRMVIMQGRLQRYTVSRWASDIVSQLLTISQEREAFLAKMFSKDMQMQMLGEYDQATARLLLLDYDGTLVPFSRRPSQAAPPRDVLSLLETLADVPENNVAIVSGRDRGTLDRWFGTLPIHLVAEHGIWVRETGGEWRMLKKQVVEWKPQIRPILERYADRLPGAFVEEKEYSLVWHYRGADPEQSELLVGELKDHLVSLTANLDLQVLQGNKVVEIRLAGVNKGTAALQWITEGPPDFILAIGDDWTDEDLFAVLPERAWSLRVGVTSTRARFNVRGSGETLRVLEAIANVETAGTPLEPMSGRPGKKHG